MRYHFPMIIPIALSRIFEKMQSCYYRLRTPLLAWLWGIKHGKNLLIQGRAIIRTRRQGEIKLGNNVVFNSDVATNLVGLINPTILDTRIGGRIEIGDDTGASSVVVSSKSSVKIGARCKIGGNVRIYDHDFHSLDPIVRATKEDGNNIRTREVVIDDDCFIGTNVLILKGTTIGARSIVAAGSVLFGLQVPSDSLVKGNPAQIVEKVK